MANFLCSIETVADREGPEAAGGERNVADLLLDQVCIGDALAWASVMRLHAHMYAGATGWHMHRQCVSPT